MANPTTNYGFVLPTPTDLVTDLPADFDVALQGVDTQLKALQPGTTSGDLAYSSATANTNVRLPIGTSGQVLAVSGGGVPAWTTTSDVTPLTTKGDLFTFTTVDARIGVGANNTVLTADSAEASGLKWAAPASGGDNFSLLNSGGTALTGASTITVSGISGKDKILVLIDNASSTDAFGGLAVRLNGDSGGNYAAYQAIFTYRTTNAFNDLTCSGALTNNAISVGAIGDNASAILNAGVTFTGCNSSGVKPFSFVGAGEGLSAAQFQQAYIGQGFYNSASTISSVSIVMSPGNFDASGRVYIYTSA